MVRMPHSLATRAITEAAPVPVPPPMPAAMKTMCEPAICERISSIASSAAASPISGLEPAPRPSVRLTPSCTLVVAVEASSACASVLATMKSTPLRPAAIMLLTALPPAPPTPITAIRGFMSVALALANPEPPARASGLMPCSRSSLRAWPASLKACLQPAPNAPEIPAALEMPLAAAHAGGRIERHLGQAQHRGIGWACGPRRPTVGGLWMSGTHGFAEKLADEGAQPRQLAGSSRDNHALHCPRGNASTLESFGNLAVQTLDATVHNLAHLARRGLRRPWTLLAGERERHRGLQIVRPCRHCATKRLDSLGLPHRGL